MGLSLPSILGLQEHARASSKSNLVSSDGFGRAKSCIILFAWGGGQVIDTTSDGGRTWYSALFTDGSPLAVARGLGSHLVAFVGSFTGASVSQYVSKDGGRTWQYQTTVGR